MSKVLVIQGAGMNMRGKSQVEIFGSATLEEIDEQIKGYAEGMGIDVELFHSNIEGEVVNALYDAHDRDFDACLINPAGYTTVAGPLRSAITQVKFPGVRGARIQPHGPRHRFPGAAGLQGRSLRLRRLRLPPGPGSRTAANRLVRCMTNPSPKSPLPPGEGQGEGVPPRNTGFQTNGGMANPLPLRGRVRVGVKWQCRGAIQG